MSDGNGIDLAKLTLSRSALAQVGAFLREVGLPGILIGYILGVAAGLIESPFAPITRAIEALVATTAQHEASTHQASQDTLSLIQRGNEERAWGQRLICRRGSSTDQERLECDYIFDRVVGGERKP